MARIVVFGVHRETYYLTWGLIVRHVRIVWHHFQRNRIISLICTYGCSKRFWRKWGEMLCWWSWRITLISLAGWFLDKFESFDTFFSGIGTYHIFALMAVYSACAVARSFDENGEKRCVGEHTNLTTGRIFRQIVMTWQFFQRNWNISYFGTYS